MSDDGWTWALASKAQSDLDSLSLDEQDRIIEKLDEIVPPRGAIHRSTVSPYRTVPTRRYVSVSFGSPSRFDKLASDLSSPGSSDEVVPTPLTTTDHWVVDTQSLPTSRFT